MPRGRPKDTDPSVEWKIHVRGSTAAKVELLLLDPMRKKVKYGARGDLINFLLEEWVANKLRTRNLSLKQEFSLRSNDASTPSPTTPSDDLPNAAVDATNAGPGKVIPDDR